MIVGIVLMCVGMAGVLVVAAMACFSAAKAHRSAEQVCREMSATWAAIDTAQRCLKRGKHAEADRGLEAAAQTILASRKRMKAAR